MDFDAATRLFIGPLLSYLLLDGLLAADGRPQVPDPGRISVLISLAMDALPLPPGEAS